MGKKKKQAPPIRIPWKEILTFAGVVLAAFLGLLGIRAQSEIPIHATQTAEARLTALVLSSTVTAISLPTETSTPTLTASPSPTTTITPTITPCLLCRIVTEPNEIAFCSTNPLNPSGVRVIARWLAEPGKKGFYISAQNSMDISSVRFSGWDPSIDGQPFSFGPPGDSDNCGYHATWNTWSNKNSPNPAVGSKVTVEFMNSSGRVVITINLTVAESKLVLNSFDYRP